MFSLRSVGGRLLEDGGWDINVQLVTAKYNKMKGDGGDEWGDEPPALASGAPMAEGEEDE